MYLPTPESKEVNFPENAGNSTIQGAHIDSGKSVSVPGRVPRQNLLKSPAFEPLRDSSEGNHKYFRRLLHCSYVWNDHSLTDMEKLRKKI